MPGVEPFLSALRPLLAEQSARAAWIFGSHARGTAAPESDIDVIVVAPSERPFVDRFRDYLPAILAAGAAIDLVVYTPEEFERTQTEKQPFLTAALESAQQIDVEQRV